MATDKLINQSQGDEIIDALDDIATNLGNISYGEQTSSDKVVAMTGYQKESAAAAISPGDSLNVAIGKLEKKVDDNTANKVAGPSSAVVGNIATFANIDGKSVQDSEVAIVTTMDDESDAEVPTSEAIGEYITDQGFAVGLDSSTANHLVKFKDNNGKNLEDTGIAVETSSASALSNDDVHIPTSKLVKTEVDKKVTSIKAPVSGSSTKVDKNNEVAFQQASGQSPAVTVTGDATNGTVTIEHQTGSGFNHLPKSGADGKYLKWKTGDDGEWVAPDSTWPANPDNKTIPGTKLVDDRFKTNETNILYALNTGVRNICTNAEYSDGTKTAQNTTFTTLADGTVTVKTPSGQTSTTDTNNFYNVWFENTSTVLIPEGTWICKLYGTDISNIRIEYSYILNGTTTTTKGNFGEAFEMTIPTGISASWLRICAKPSTSFDSSFKIVVCNKAAWEADPPTEYIPFAKSNYQLTAEIGDKLDKTEKGAASGVAELDANGKVPSSQLPSSMTPTSHTHGNIQNGGTLQSNDISIASGDKLVVTDSSDSNKIARASISFDGSTATQALTKKGTWETFNNYSHPTTSGNKHIPSGGSSGQILRWSADGTAAWGADNDTWIAMVGATASANGSTGYVNATPPKDGYNTKYLRADGSWQVPPNTTYSAATTSAAGLMSADDKTKLNGIATGATAVSESTVSGWGFTKNTGTYSKPSTGIPKTDLATAVQTSLGNADSALQSHQTIKQDGITGATVNRFGTCSTAAATAAKTVSITSGTFNLEAGARVTVEFTNANTAGTPTLNVNSKGAKNIFHKGAQITTGGNKSLLAGTVDFIYDGTQWHLIGNYIDTNDNTYPSAYCSTAAGTAAKVATCTGYALLSKSYIHVIITTSNTSASALTLNINSKGAKPIYINGSASSSSNYTLPAGSYLVYYNGTNYYFRTDGKITAAGIVDIGGNTAKFFKGDGTLATPVTIDSALSSTSTNPVQNKVINAALGDINSVLEAVL